MGTPMAGEARVGLDAAVGSGLGAGAGAGLGAGLGAGFGSVDRAGVDRRRALGAIALAWLGVPAALGVRRAAGQPEGVPPERLVPERRDVTGMAGFEPNRLSLAQWSLHTLLHAGEMDHLDFAREARAMGFDGIEYVNSFFKDRATDVAYLAAMNRRASDEGVRQLLIMCDGEGHLGDPDEAGRSAAVQNHRKWLDAARALGCDAIRVNAASAGSFEEQQRLAADGLRRLCELADPLGLSVLVENHGGLSSHGGWLSGVMRLVDHPRVGTLPDFGNFCMDWSRSGEADAWYDRYRGVDELMPFARAVSAKSHAFDAEGNETGTDYARMLGIVARHGYRGWIGVEWEGGGLPAREGIAKTKALIERVHSAMAGVPAAR